MGVYVEVGGQIGQKLQKTQFLGFFQNFDIFISRLYRRVSTVHIAKKIFKICKIDPEKINF